MNPEELARTGTEHANQTALFCWAALAATKYPLLQMMFAIPNGSQRSMITGARLKAEGVKPGVPDIMLPIASGKCHGLFIEMKRITPLKRGVMGEQLWWQNALNEAGYLAVVCYGWEEARDIILTYLRY